LKARSARRNGTAIWGDENLKEKPTGRGGTKMIGRGRRKDIAQEGE
jgi:hypothetical protein